MHAAILLGLLILQIILFSYINWSTDSNSNAAVGLLVSAIIYTTLLLIGAVVHRMNRENVNRRWMDVTATNPKLSLLPLAALLFVGDMLWSASGTPNNNPSYVVSMFVWIGIVAWVAWDAAATHFGWTAVDQFAFY